MDFQQRDIRYLGSEEYADTIDIYEATITRNDWPEDIRIEMKPKDDGTVEFGGVWDSEEIGGAHEYAAADRAVENGDYNTIDEALVAFSRKAQQEMETNRELEAFLQPMASEIETAILPHHDRVHPEAAEKRQEKADIEKAVVMLNADGYYDSAVGEEPDWYDNYVEASGEGDAPLIAPGPDGQHFAMVMMPESLRNEFSIDTLKELGVRFDDDDNVAVISVKIDGDQVGLDRQYEAMSYADRFETAVFNHHKNDLEQEVARMAADADAAKVTAKDSVTVSGDTESDARDGYLKVSIDDTEFNVIASFDDHGRVSDVAVDPDQEGGTKDGQLTELLDSVKDSVVLRAQEYHDNADQRVLKDTGWHDSRMLDAGYCVISPDEIDRIDPEVAFSESGVISGDFKTAEGHPIRLEIDGNANIERATIPGTNVSLNPVLEGSRNHFVEAKAQLADDGIVLSKAESGGYRVDYHSSSSSHREGECGSVRFADSVSGAVDIGRKMATDRDQQTQQDDEGPARQAA